MFIVVSAFILKQICRCLFTCVCSDPCSVLHFSLFAFCKSLNVVGRGNSQNPSHKIGTWELWRLSSQCTQRASAILPLGKRLHPHNAISQDTSAGAAKSSRGCGGEHRADGLDLPEATWVSAAGSFQLPEFCVPSLVSNPKTIPVPMEVPDGTQSSLGCRAGGIKQG